MAEYSQGVVRLDEHRSRIVDRGLAALKNGSPVADIVAAVEILIRTQIDATRFIAALNEGGGATELKVQDRLRLYEICARGSAIIPRSWPEKRQLGHLDGFEREFLRRRDTYHCFTPAWELSDLLKSTFGDDDPGVVIGRHMAMLFDRERLVDPELHLYLQQGDEVDASGLIGALLGWISRSVGVPRNEVEVCECIASGASAAEMLRPEVALPGVIAALTVPQPLFSTLAIWVAGLGLVDLAHGHGSEQPTRRFFADLLVWLLLCCTAVSIDPEDARRMEANATEILKGVAALDATPSPDGVEEARTNLRSVLGALFSLVRERIADRASAANYAPVFPPQLLPHLVAGGDVYDSLVNDRVPSIALPDHIRQMQRYRHRVLGGYAPIELEESFLLADLLWHEWPKHDVVIQLSQLWMSGRDPSGEMTTLPAWFGSKYHDDVTAMLKRASAFKALFRAAKEDGLEEMASAIAAFFVFSQALRYGGRLGDWSEIGPWLHDAVGAPGAQTLEKAIVSARGQAEARRDAISVARLDSLLTVARHRQGHGGRLMIANPAMGATVPGQVLELLEARFGRERLARLSPDAVRYWTNAHAKEAAHRGQQLFGLVEEWGSVAEDLCKPFEAELVARLGAVYRSDWYRSFKKSRREPYGSKTPTLGHVLFLLHDYQALPPELRAQVDAAIDIQRSRGLKKRLELLASEHRNAGAHPESYSIDKLNELMSLLYGRETGLWDQFLDALVPSTD
jgi:hypothetical protein